MKIVFCTPFKPVDHPKISGDVTIARDLFETLKYDGHEVVQLPYFSAKTIYDRKDDWEAAEQTRDAMIEAARGADCWLTYGSYYKVPDVFGPTACDALGLPYFIFQASYAVNRSKKESTRPGYELNKHAMLRADHIFCNRVNDVRGCAKLLPEDRYSYVKPGLPDRMFSRNEEARTWLRDGWGVGNSCVIMTAAMMRAGVKVEGLRWVFESCSELISNGRDIQLVVAGDGPHRTEMQELAESMLGDRVTFLGMVDRMELAGVFSAGDIFAFPGLEESVGMVYLEAQLCGLPVVATDDEGAPHVVAHDSSGLITSVSKTEFTHAVDQLVGDADLRQTLGEQAVEYVEKEHMAANNYREMVRMMERVVEQRKS